MTIEMGVTSLGKYTLPKILAFPVNVAVVPSSARKNNSIK
jgi:hypothetical protein